MSSTTVNFNLKDAGFANFANQTLTFRLLTTGADKTDDTVILPGVITATSAANGTGSVSLFRNGESDINSVFEVVFPNRERSKFVIPSGSSSINLSDLLVDHVPSGAATQQSTVFDAAIQRVNHTGTQPLSTISDATEGVQDIVGGMVAGNTETGITVTYEDSDGTLDFVVASQTDQNFTTALKNKLDGIATGATGNLTNNEIRNAVEAADDSNTFTNADHTKLNSIAGSTTEEIQDIAGTLVATGGTKTGITVTYDDANNNMDFVVASQTDENFTTADHSKLDGIEASATADQTASEIRTLVESATDSNVFTDADHTKLNSVDANSKAQVNFVPKSVSFTNTSAFLSVASNANLNVGTGDFSFSFAARVSATSNTPVLQKNGTAGYAVFFSNGTLKLTLNSSGTSDFDLATGLNDNKWHTYVITVDRDDTAIAYVDNVAQTGVNVSGKAGNLDNTANFQIGLVGNSPGSSIALGNYVSLHKEELTSTVAGNIYFSPDTALTAGSTQLMVDLRKADKTFSDISTNGFAVTASGVIIFNEARTTSLDGVTIGATTAAAVTGTTITASTKFAGAIDGTVGATTPAAGTFTSISASDGNITNVGDINCDSISADDAATGLNVIFDGTDTGDNKITLTDNLASALDITESTNSYLKFTTTNTGEKVVLGKDLDISGDHDLIIGTSTGTKIGTATGQKIGFFNATPVVQQNTAGTTTGFTIVGGGTDPVQKSSTFTGNFGTRAYTIGDIVLALKTLGLLQKDN